MCSLWLVALNIKDQIACIIDYTEKTKLPFIDSDLLYTSTLKVRCDCIWRLYHIDLGITYMSWFCSGIQEAVKSYLVSLNFRIFYGTIFMFKCKYRLNKYNWNYGVFLFKWNSNFILSLSQTRFESLFYLLLNRMWISAAENRWKEMLKRWRYSQGRTL